MEADLYKSKCCDNLERNYLHCHHTKCKSQFDLFDTRSWFHIFDKCDACIPSYNIWKNCDNNIKSIKFYCKLIFALSVGGYICLKIAK